MNLNNNNNNKIRTPIIRLRLIITRAIAVEYISNSNLIISSSYIPPLKLGTSAEHCYIGMTFFLLLLLLPADLNHHSIISTKII